MSWKFTDATRKVANRTNPDGSQESRLASAITEPIADPDPDPIPPNMSDPDEHAKVIKTLALCIADAAGWTIPQLKAKFKAKWDSLP